MSTECAKKGCYYFGVQVFNNLPSSMKEAESLLIFKTMIKNFLVITLRIFNEQIKKPKPCITL